MKSLHSELMTMLNVPGVYVYCTGRTEYLSLHVLSGNRSPLRPYPILLHALTAEDIKEMFSLQAKKKKKKTDDVYAPLHRIAANDEVLDRLCDRLAELSGGNGRMIQYALENLALVCCYSEPIRSVEEVEQALQRTWKRIKADLALPLAANQTLQKMVLDSSLLTRSGTDLLLQQPFDADATIEVAGQQMLYRDALSILGFSVTPHADNTLLAVAGDWQLLSLPESVLNAHFALIVSLSKKLTAAIGADRGTLFELLCVSSLMRFMKSAEWQGKELQDLLPHLKDSHAGRMKISALRMVLLPKFTTVAKHLSPEEKVALMEQRDVDEFPRTERKALHVDDLTWVVHEWMVDSSIGVFRGQSASPDVVLKALPFVTSIAIKCYGVSEFSMKDLDEEIGKMPYFESTDNVLSTLVVFSTNYDKTLKGKTSISPQGAWRKTHNTNVSVVVVDPQHKNGLNALLSSPATLDLSDEKSDLLLLQSIVNARSLPVAIKSETNQECAPSGEK